ncbi:uncharacterized protein EI97DRAFT_7245 [Westerdykella ornata]|uniref:DH domain-containing protein n=1 Tax=Westerdykella ornata TaxID=318751 RepID=A0A6A6JXF0_WESOR|nr:uncharacterized protein EI97DRAFT_7245 [Westerdykella ornata]KAF2280743.1 hypothetical protein EI97DRAFT_7245 [Westerdykella ornata]
MVHRDNTAMHNFAYHPSVASWVQSTSIATQLDDPAEDPSDPSPDDFYRYPPPDVPSRPLAHTDGMTTTRQRQTSQGAVGASRPPFRTSPHPPPRTRPPQMPSNPRTILPPDRPSVKSLAQKFSQAPEKDESPVASRRRAYDAAGSTPPSRRPLSSRSVSDTQAMASSSSPRPAREISYGPHKFNNLKPRERPQPAPPSPARLHKGDGNRKDVEKQTSPARLTPSSSPRKHHRTASSGRRPFFGEVVGEHDAGTPGFGIPIADSLPGSELKDEVPGEIPLPPNEAADHATMSTGQGRSTSGPPSASTNLTLSSTPPDSSSPREKRRSPPSRIPVATRRLSVASDSSSSVRSSPASSARPPGGFARNNHSRRPLGTNEILPATSNHNDRERGKQATSTLTKPATSFGSAAKAASPRLRHARERQFPTPGSTGAHSHAPEGPDELRSHTDPPCNPEELSAEDTSTDHGLTNAIDGADGVGVASPAASNHLTLETATLGVPHSQAAPYSTTDFQYEESPVLGIPGSFMVTPPLAHTQSPIEQGQGSQQSQSQSQSQRLSGNVGAELLQPLVFQPASVLDTVKTVLSEATENDPSELGVRESIPIMLGAENGPTQGTGSNERPKAATRLSIGDRRWRAEPLDDSGTISYLEEDHSPTDPNPLPNRDTLRPEDSASNVAFYSQARQPAEKWAPQAASGQESNGMTLDSEAYSVINKVLNTYHSSPKITPQVAEDARREVQRVSPVIAQHEDWGSKESTETYLARVLSDANGVQQRSAGYTSATTESNHIIRHSKAVVGYSELEDDAGDSHTSGTAIIFPSESRRYSRGSHASTATTIHDDRGRVDTSSEDREAATPALQLLPSTTFVPPPPAQDQSFASGPVQHYRDSYGRPDPASYHFLPEIKSTGEGLGLGLEANQQKQRRLQEEENQHLGQSSKWPGHSSLPHYPPTPTTLPSSASQPTQSFTSDSNRRGNMRLPPASEYVDGSHDDFSSYALTSSVSGSERNRFATRAERIQVAKEARAMHEVQTGQQTQTAPKAQTEVRPGYGVHTTQEVQTAHAPTDDVSLHPTLNDSLEKLDRGKSQEDSRDIHGDKSHEGGRASDQTTESVHPAAFPGEDSDAIARRLHHRYRIIEELCRTENDYMSDLMVVRHVWMATAQEVFPDPHDQATLFCNVVELSDFHNQFVIDLKNAFRQIAHWKFDKESDENLEQQYQQPKEPEVLFKYCNLDNDNHTSVGYVFKYWLPKIEALYTKYLLNHDKANKMIVAHRKEPDFDAWQKECVKGSKDITDAWDLDSLLVKPVQRLLKYPLILQSLKDDSPKTHDDYADIVFSLESLLDINKRINELKKRQETLRLATKEGKKEKKKGFRGIDIVKALKGNQKSPKPAPGDTIFTDPVYEQHFQKFGGNFFQLQIVKQDLDKYSEDLTAAFLHLNIVTMQLLALAEDQMGTNLETRASWQRTVQGLLELRQKLLEDHKQAIHLKIYRPIMEVWGLYSKPQAHMEKRKKLLAQYTKYKQALDRKEEVDSKLKEAAQQFEALNETLKDELPKLYNLTRLLMMRILESFVNYQKQFWKNCQKKILPLLEYEPEHTSSFTHDLRDYVARFKSDFSAVQNMVSNLEICNGRLIYDMANFQSPHTSIYTVTDDGSSRKSTSRRTESINAVAEDGSSRRSTSRRTESINSDTSLLDHRHRRSGTTPSQRNAHTLEAPPRSAPHGGIQSQQKSAGDYAWEIPAVGSSSRLPAQNPSPRALQEQRTLSPSSERSDLTVTRTGRSSLQPFPNLGNPEDGCLEGASSPRPVGQLGSFPSSSRGSAIFSSALPMSDSPSANRSVEELHPSTPADLEEPEVLFLAASLFEFNIAHDRREGGIPYLVYVPGEIFDVIGMKGELWLARNQDDPSRTVGWIWEKHFARILPEEV